MEMAGTAAAKLLATSQTGLQTKHDSSSLRQALADRVGLSEAIELVGMLIRRYPNGGGNAGKDYIGGLANVLMHYPRSVVLRCHDPMEGVPRDVKFLPTPSDVIAWCERQTDQMRGPVEREDRDTRILREMRERREEGDRWDADRAQRPTLAELKQKHGENWGLGEQQDDKRVAATKEQLQRANDTLRQRENAAAGMDPDSQVSAALVKVLREKGVVPRQEAAE